LEDEWMNAGKVKVMVGCHNREDGGEMQWAMWCI